MAWWLTILVGLASPATVAAQCPPIQQVTGISRAGASCRFDATLTRLFTPASVPPGTYSVYVSPAALEMLAETLRQAPTQRAPDAWTVERPAPLEAFGDGGAYDRARLSRLYVGLRPRVARGAVIKDGRAVASIWLISPYPDASLSRLERGTLIIVFDLTKVK